MQRTNLTYQIPSKMQQLLIFLITDELFILIMLCNRLYISIVSLDFFFGQLVYVTPRIPNNVNHTCKSEYYNVYGMLHFVKYLNNSVKFSINKVNNN